MIWTSRLIARVAGIGICGVGLFCLPVGIGASPKRDTSIFFHFADLGAYLRIAAILIPLGIAIALLSFVLPGRD